MPYLYGERVSDLDVLEPLRAQHVVRYQLHVAPWRVANQTAAIFQQDLGADLDYEAAAEPVNLEQLVVSRTVCTLERP